MSNRIPHAVNQTPEQVARERIGGRLRTFHRPEIFKAWSLAPRSFCSGIATLPPLNPVGLRECQINAITNLEASLKADRPRALVQMATGAGKTFPAITQVYGC